jgi:multicomponent Na+:H+ antiporter subunit E
MTRKARSIVVNTVALFGIWLVFSGRSGPFYVGAGLGSALLVAWLRIGLPASPAPPFPWRRFLLYVPWLLSRIILANLHVAALILNPRQPIAPKLLRYRTALHDPRAVVLLANSITLTPGTITVEVSQDTLVVHALDADSTGDLLTHTLERKVARVFTEQRGA